MLRLMDISWDKASLHQERLPSPSRFIKRGINTQNLSMEARIIVRNVWRRYRLTNDINPRDHTLKYGVNPKKMGMGCNKNHVVMPYGSRHDRTNPVRHK